MSGKGFYKESSQNSYVGWPFTSVAKIQVKTCIAEPELKISLPLYRLYYLCVGSRFFVNLILNRLRPALSFVRLHLSYLVTHPVATG